MKLLVLIALITTTVIYPQWKLLHPTPTYYNYNDIASPSPNRVCIVTDFGYLYISDDKGDTWREIKLETVNLKKIYFYDDKLGWIIPDTNSHVLRSTDGGDTWQNINYPDVGKMRVVQFISKNIGYAACDSGHILKTIDGGNNWFKYNHFPVVYSNNVEYGITEMEVITENKMFIISNKIDEGNSFIYFTQDAGITWQKIENTYDACNLCFADSLNGFYGAYNEKLYKTTDGGLTWKILINYSLEKRTNNVYIIEDIEYKYGILSVCFDANVISKNMGGTMKWNSGLGIFGLTTILDSNTIISLTLNHIIYRSTDGGETLEKLHDRSISGIIKFVNDSLGYLSNHFQFFKTYNGGVNFETLIKESSDFWMFDVLNKDTLFIAGSENAGGIWPEAFIKKSTDGGLTWEDKFFNLSSLGSEFVYIYFADQKTGWVSDWTQTLKTTNCGESWFYLNSYFPTLLAFENKDTGYAVYGNSITRTTDGLLSFTMEYQIPDLSAIFINAKEQNGIAGTSNGAIYYMNNGQWFKSEFGLSIKIADCSISKDSKLAFFTCEDGSVYQSKDGGVSWFKTIRLAYSNHPSIFIVNKDKAFITGSGDYYFGPGGAFYEYSTSNPPNSLYNEVIYKSDYFISQNYPNPFNPSTTIKYNIPEHGLVTIKVFDLLGREIRTLINEEKHSGSYEITFNADGLPSGIYFYSIYAGKFSETRKMLLVK